MQQKLVCMILAIWLLLLFAPSALAFAFSDSEFLGRYTTEALDEIIDKYELYDGWYWTSEAGVLQDYHGQAGKPGWTDTAVNGSHRYGYEKGWYGCRWGIDRINEKDPNDYGYGECFGFAQFIGYLLSGDQNAHGNWDTFSTVKLAGGLKVGDIIRVDYYMEGRHCVHSAVVYNRGGRNGQGDPLFAGGREAVQPDPLPHGLLRRPPDGRNRPERHRLPAGPAHLPKPGK